MTNLRCPNCNHLIGVLDGIEPPHPDVAEWLECSQWKGKKTARSLGDEYHSWAREYGRAMLSDRLFGQALRRAGLVAHKGTKGARMWSRG